MSLLQLSLGDYTEDTALNFKFHSKNKDHELRALGGSPLIGVYKGSGTTHKTSAESYITLITNFDGFTGLNAVEIDTSADVFFETGEDYTVTVDNGTVDGVSWDGTVVGTFSIEHRHATNAATVNAEMLDVMNVDIFAQAGQETPPTSQTLAGALMYLYKFLVNRRNQTGTTFQVFNSNAVTIDHKAAVSDNGTVAEHGEVITGI